ncbi:MAG: hypothetical protein EXR52_07130 [Dehalococcoidia bacterium]|nr:hypothetical protein [Dehalococcoidia bacterium]
MAESGFVYMDPDQTGVFYQEFLKRVGETDEATFNEGRFKMNLDRCMQMAQAERGDLARLFAHNLIQLLRDKDRTFSKRPMGMSLALLFAWLHRNGAMLWMEPAELEGVMRTIAAGGVYLEDVDQYLRQYIRQAE